MDMNEMNDSNKQLIHEIADALTSRGYIIGESLSGKRVDEPQPDSIGQYNSIGILVDASIKIGRFTVPFTKRFAYVADLWIDNMARNAVPDERWVLDVYGSENVANAQSLVEKMAEPYGVEVAAKVSIDQTRFEGQELYFPEVEKHFKWDRKVKT